MTKIDIISGFLGAGKTTFIKKLLEEAIAGEKVVLIENEFGEIGIDGGFLQDSGIEIREMNSGCICCSLVGDFGRSLSEVLTKYEPDRVIIEPSGVGKLSDVMKAVCDVAGEIDVVLNGSVTVVDAQKCKMYMKNFGEFFNNQIESAGTIVLSRTDVADADKVAKAVELIREKNPKAAVVTTPIGRLTGAQLLEIIEKPTDDMAAELLEEVRQGHHHHEDEECCCGHDHEHHHHHHGNSALENYSLISDQSKPVVCLVTGIVLAALVALVLLGGVKRIGNVAEKLVPFMALFYILLALGVILLHANRIPLVFSMIFEGAFHPQAVTGGLIGSFFTSMKRGVSRGIFSNEAGLGTGSIAHACADTKKPVKQGFFGIFEVFTDTIVICTLTALVILCSGVTVNYGQAAGAELTISGFTSTYGSWVSIFTAISMCCFAFSTIIGWGLYGARCIEFIFDEKIIKPFMVAYSLVAILGATVDLGLLWSIADTFNGLMAIPNLIGVFLLSKTVFKLTREYFETEGKDPFLS